MANHIQSRCDLRKAMGVVPNPANPEKELLGVIPRLAQMKSEALGVIPHPAGTKSEVVGVCKCRKTSLRVYVT